nr:GNAT family N-acetyltransferase [Rhodococcus sp. HNM0569]
MDAVADDPPPTVAEFTHAMHDGHVWVHDHPDVRVAGDRPVAYAVVFVVDDGAHLEQVSVHPDHAHHGLGAGLIEHVSRWAARRGIRRLTLTTFVDVPWNAPYYRRLGFTTMPDADVTPGLEAIRARESRLAELWPRVIMTRPVAVPGEVGRERELTPPG